MIKRKFKKIIIIFFGFLVLFISLISLNFYFSRDTIIRIVPSDFLFYGHLNLNSLSWPGRKNQQLLTRFWIKQLNQNLNNQEISQFFQAITQSEVLSQFKELSLIVFFRPETSQFEIAIIGKTKKPIQIDHFFSNRQSVKLLEPRTFIFTPQTDLLNRFFPKSPSKQSPRQFFSSNFLDGLLNLDKIIEIFKNNQRLESVWESFLIEQEMIPDFLKVKIWAKEGIFFFKIGSSPSRRLSIKNERVVDPVRNMLRSLLQLSKNIDSCGWVSCPRRVSNGVDDFSEFIKFIPLDTNLFFRNFNLSEKLFSKIFLPTKLNLAKPNIFIFQPPASLELQQGEPVYLFIYKKSQPIEEIENQLKEGIAFYFPQEVKRVLPDQSEVIELVADPSLINLSQQKINQFLVKYWQKENFEVALAGDGKFIFLSNNFSLLEKSLTNNQTDIFLFSKERCPVQGEETIFWQPSGQQFWLIANQIDSLNFQGCLIQ